MSLPMTSELSGGRWFPCCQVQFFKSLLGLYLCALHTLHCVFNPDPLEMQDAAFYRVEHLRREAVRTTGGLGRSQAYVALTGNGECRHHQKSEKLEAAICNSDAVRAA